MQATPSHDGRKDSKFKVCSAHSIYSTVSERTWSFLKSMKGGLGRAGGLVSQVPREQTMHVGFSVNCGYSRTPEKQALGLLKKEVGYFENHPTL